MSDELGYARARMLISSMFNSLTSGNRFDINRNTKIIEYNTKFGILDMGGGIVLIREQSIGPMTDEYLVFSGFGC